MKVSVLLGAVAAACLSAGHAAAGTLDEVRANGKVRCGVIEGTPGFSYKDSEGRYQGFDVEFCRALAAAVFNDTNSVDFVEITSQNQFAALRDGEVDVLYRTTSWTFRHDVGEKVNFVGVTYYDGQGFMVPKALGFTSALELNGATVCLNAGTSAELNLSDYFRLNGMTYVPLPTGGAAGSKKFFEEGACDVYTTDASALASTRATLKDPSAYLILPEIISKEPLGPAVAQGDDDWADLVRWVQNALITAEERGITSVNVAELSKGTEDPEVNRILGTEGELGKLIGLEPDWAARAIAAVGNYGEIFDRTIGEGSPIGLARGLNALYTNGGLQYSPPFR